ncbi:hypothetical protein CQA18_25215, partial [Enterobacter hormaechei]
MERGRFPPGQRQWQPVHPQRFVSRQADFSDATLNQCNLRQMPLQRANFSRARLNNCD